MSKNTMTYFGEKMNNNALVINPDIYENALFADARIDKTLT